MAFPAPGTAESRVWNRTRPGTRGAQVLTPRGGVPPRGSRNDCRLDEGVAILDQAIGEVAQGTTSGEVPGDYAGW